MSSSVFSHNTTITELLRAMIDEAHEEARDIAYNEWLTALPFVAVEAHQWRTTDTSLHLEDIIDDIWARLVTGQRLHPALRDLHDHILTTAGVPDGSTKETVLAFFPDAVTLPRRHDWRGNITLITAVAALHTAFTHDDHAAVRQAMEGYVACIAAEGQTVH